MPTKVAPNSMAPPTLSQAWSVAMGMRTETICKPKAIISARICPTASATRSHRKHDGAAASPTITHTHPPLSASNGSLTKIATVYVAPMAKPKPAQK